VPKARRGSEIYAGDGADSPTRAGQTPAKRLAHRIKQIVSLIIFLMATFQISEQSPTTVVLSLSTLLDPTENQQILDEVVRRLTAGATFWVIDLQSMSYLSSTGLNFLISVLTRTRTLGGEVVIVGISEKIQQVLVLTRLMSMFVIRPDVSQALAFLQDSNKKITL
jgi:anti-sigma B factor antagonist